MPASTGLIGHPLTSLWEFDATATADYDDNTVEAAIEDGTEFTILDDTLNFVYFGLNRRFDALMAHVATTSSIGKLTWEFSNAVGTWIRFIPTIDYNFLSAERGYLRWDVKGMTEVSDWNAVTLTTSAPDTASSVPDSVARYYIRVATASVNTAPTIKSIVCRPYTTYGTVKEVQNQLQLTTPFSSSTTPSSETVEDFLRGAEDSLIYLTGKSWRVEFIENEELNFKMYGMKLRYEPIIDVYGLGVWNGSEFGAKVEGRNNDYHIDRETGIMYVSTVFLSAMPPGFRRSYTSRREQGSYKRAVQANYSWGYDIRRHPFGAQVGRIAVYQACIDIVTNLDFSPLIPLGLDTINLQAKVDNWSKDVQEFKDTFPKLKIY